MKRTDKRRDGILFHLPPAFYFGACLSDYAGAWYLIFLIAFVINMALVLAYLFLKK